MGPIFFTGLQNYFMNNNLPNFVSLTDKEVLCVREGKYMAVSKS